MVARYLHADVGGEAEAVEGKGRECTFAPAPLLQQSIQLIDGPAVQFQFIIGVAQLRVAARKMHELLSVSSFLSTCGVDIVCTAAVRSIFLPYCHKKHEPNKLTFDIPEELIGRTIGPSQSDGV